MLLMIPLHFSDLSDHGTLSVPAGHGWHPAAAMHSTFMLQHLIGDANHHLYHAALCAMQRGHWHNSHKQVCKAPDEESPESKANELLRTAKLLPEQIIQRNAPAPALPRHLPDNLSALSRIMPPDEHAIFVYNKDTMRNRNERICPKCKTRYRSVLCVAFREGTCGCLGTCGKPCAQSNYYVCGSISG